MRRSVLIVLLSVWMAPPAWALSVETVSLGNQTDAWMARDATLPIVDVLLSFEGAGTASDPSGKEGRAAFAAAMLTEGAGKLSALEFARALDAEAIQLSVDAQSDRVLVRVRALRENAARAGQLLTLALTKPTLAAPDIERIRQAFLTHLALLSEEPGYLANRRLEARAFGGHPYANPPYGTPATIAAMREADLRDYIATHIARGRLLVTAAGDVDAALLRDMLKPLVHELPYASPPAVRVVSMQGEGEHIVEPHRFSQSTVVFAAPGIARDDPDFFAAYVLNHILGGNALVSRLSQQVRQEQGLVYSVATTFDIREGAALLRGALASRNETADRARRAVIEQVAQLSSQGVTREECQDARSHVLGAFAQEIDSTRDLNDKLMLMRVFHLGQDYLQTRMKAVAAVRCEDVTRMARRLLDPKRFLFVTVGGSTTEAP